MSELLPIDPAGNDFFDSRGREIERFSNGVELCTIRIATQIAQHSVAAARKKTLFVYEYIRKQLVIAFG